MNAEPFLRHLAVIETGDRLATGLCGSLLQRLGAEVTVVEPPTVPADPASRWPHRALLAAGKNSVIVDPGSAADRARLESLIATADVVVTSSDWQSALPADSAAMLARVPIRCDITAFGRADGDAPWTDAMLQAFAGLMDTTGSADGPPTPTDVPIAECSAALFAASGILAALRRRGAAPQRVDVALFDSAFSMLSTFLPKYFAGGEPTRIGNRHPSMSPWNAYRANDGWVLLCSASDDMWGRVCAVVGRDALKSDPRFAIMSGRVANADAADAAIEPWIVQHSVAECVERFTAAAVPCGPVCTIAELLRDPDLAARGAFVRLQDPESGRTITVPGTPIRGSRAAPNDPAGIPRRGEGAAQGAASTRPRTPVASSDAPAPGKGVLDGLRVVEMGNYTTAPLAARNLAAMGAYVVKVEPPGGELARAAPPQRGGQSYLCTFSNNDKRCVALDLQKEQGRALFADLLAHADVFVDNMKPGVLARFGFGPAQIEQINPRIVYCSVSGFGTGSALGQRPAMDATIQGMAGLMDLTRQGEVPYKVGVSVADIVGGQFALLAILAGLEHRARTGTGQTIDISMHEVTAWLTQLVWNDGPRPPRGTVERQGEGYVYATAGRTVPVNTVSAVARHAETVRRGVLVEGRSRDGTAWPLLACAIRMSPWPTVVKRAIGAVGADLDEVLHDWGMAAPEVAGRR